MAQNRPSPHPHATIPVRRQAARVTAQSSEQLGLPGESSEEGISLSLVRSLSLSPPPSLLAGAAAREKEGEAHADSWREPQRVQLVCARIHQYACVFSWTSLFTRVRIIIVARKSFLWLCEGGSTSRMKSQLH